MGFEPLGRILPQAIQKAGIVRQVTAAHVLETGKQVLERLWGEEKAGCVQFISFAEGVLKATTTVPAAAQEMRVLQMQLQNEINHVLGAKTVVRLWCVLQ